MGPEDEVAKRRKLRLIQEAERVAVLYQIQTDLAEAGARESTLEERMASYPEDIGSKRKVYEESRENAAQFALYASGITNRAKKLPKPIVGAYLLFARLKFVIKRGQILGYYLLGQYQQLTKWQSTREADVAQMQEDEVMVKSRAGGKEDGRIQKLEELVALNRGIVQTFEMHRGLIIDFWKVLYPKNQFPLQALEKQAY